MTPIPFLIRTNMIEFKAKTIVSINVYITPKHYVHVRFEGKSDGTSFFLCNNVAFAMAMFKTAEYKKGIITSDTKPEDIAPKVAAKPVQKEKVKEDAPAPVDETAEDTSDIPDEGQNDGKETVTFADFAMAVSFLVERGGKKSELRSVKAVKERGAELGYNIIIEE